MSDFVPYGVFKDGNMLAVMELPQQGEFSWYKMEDGIEMVRIDPVEYQALLEKFKKRQELGLYPK